jgi:hypothetical protein
VPIYNPGSGGGSGAPTSATYLLQTPNASLPSAQAISALATGLLKGTTTTGVVSAITDSAGLAGVISDATGSGALVFANTPTLVTPNIGVATGTRLVTRLTIDSSGLMFGTHTGIAAETITGYITIKDEGGTTRKLAVVS